MSKVKFDQTKYQNQWNKQNLAVVSAQYKKEFVIEFREACKKLGISQSEVIRQAIIDTIEKATEK